PDGVQHRRYSSSGTAYVSGCLRKPFPKGGAWTTEKAYVSPSGPPPADQPCPPGSSSPKGHVCPGTVLRVCACTSTSPTSTPQYPSGRPCSPRWRTAEPSIRPRSSPHRCSTHAVTRS